MFIRDMMFEVPVRFQVETRSEAFQCDSRCLANGEAGGVSLGTEQSGHQKPQTTGGYLEWRSGIRVPGQGTRALRAVKRKRIQQRRLKRTRGEVGRRMQKCGVSKAK